MIRNSAHRCVGAVVIVLAGTSLGAASRPSDVPAAIDERAVDSLFAQWNSDSTPGCAVGAMQGGALRLAKGYGMADLASGVPLGPGTVMGVASLSKQFTAAAVALLAEEGRVDPDAEIQAWLREFPAYQAPIRVRDLLHHTSGLRDYLSMIGLAGGNAEGRIPRSVALGLIMRQRAVNGVPGQVSLYSNTNYYLLGEIVARAASMDFRRFMHTRIFAPLGMRSTRFARDGETVPGQAESYRLGDDGALEQVALPGMLFAEGGAYSTIEDLARWEAQFHAPRLGPEPARLIRRLRSRGTSAGGQPIDYGWGTQFGEYRGAATEAHGGTWGGFRSYFLRVPSHQAAFAVLCNQLEISPFQLTRRLADIYLGSRLAPQAEPPPPPVTPPMPEPAPAGTPLDSATGADLFGAYTSDELEARYTISAANDGSVVLGIARSVPLALRLTGTDTLGASARQLVVERNEAGCVTGFILNSGRVRGVRFARERPGC